jgi:hypothetical protein
MSILDLFESRWSAQAITPHDRRRLFWYLKRQTSYTGWKREAHAFDAFAAVFEKQARDEPVAKSNVSCGDTRWELFYPQVLKGQVLYEKGLQRLLSGDRTVWLYNELGILDDAGTISGHWYSELVNHGMRGDHFYDGKYLDELTESIKQFSLASRETGILQSMMADTPAREAWSTFWKEKFSKLPVPADLLEVPIPTTELLVRTGQDAPVFGIYEPQIKDGCMNYLLGGVPAPTIWESDGTYATGKKLSVIWRLLWEDNRYVDGQIPSEEEHYFPPEESVAAPVIASVSNDLVSAFTNETCPQSGEWAVIDNLSAKAIIRQGEKIPQHEGKDVSWVWLRK